MVSRTSRPRSADPVRRQAALLWLLLGLFCAAPLAAQPLPPEIPEGHVLVDDLILPEEVVYGDANFTATAWPNGVIPYAFNANVSAANQVRALEAMAEWEALADVDFVPRGSQTNYIEFRDSTGNSSSVGMVGGVQYVNMFNWTWKYIICHELMHAMGFLHEQSRPDRNNFVQINTANIEPGREHNFNRNAGATTVGAYDFLSIMHYGRTAFSVNGQDTITVLPPNQAFQSQIGNRSYMTTLDAQGLANRYGPPARPVITNLSTSSIQSGSSAFTLTVSGNLFFEGSPSSNGVQGSEILLNGNGVSTTFVDANTLRCTVSSALLATPGCINVVVRNASPAGGDSLSAAIQVWSDINTATMTYGQGDGDLHGYTVVALGDINADGLDDYAVGAPGWSADRGRVQGISGANGAQLWLRTGGTDQDFGHAMARCGDLTGDGITELIVGGPGYGNDRGLVRVLNGASGAIVRTFFGVNSSDRFGEAVSSEGDLDGDGTPDYVIGAPGYASSQGRVYVYDGASGSLVRTHDGASAGVRLGAAVTSRFDMGGNGLADVIAGAPSHDGNGTNAGRVRLFSGQTGSQLMSLLGTAAGDQFGYSLTMVSTGEGNNEGFLIAGAPQIGSISASYGPGEVKVVGPFQSGVGYPVLATLTGNSTNDTFGYRVAPGGDLDGDGAEDFLVGSPDAGGFLNIGAGAVEAFSSVGFNELFRRTGVNGSDRFGVGLAGGLDVNGDGQHDIVVGAYAADEYCTSQGETTVLSFLYPPSQRKVLITEVCWGNPDGVEITNHGTSTVDLQNWRLRWEDASGVFLSVPLGITLAPNEIAIVTETGTGYPETPVANVQIVDGWTVNLPTTSSEVTVSLLDPTGFCTDEVRASSTVAATNALGHVGLFRGLALRTNSVTATGSVERIWGLDSNSGGDWTEQLSSSMGIENRSSGARGTDPIAVPAVVINELDDDPDYIEFRNRSGGTVNVQNWMVLTSSANNSRQAIIRPWEASTSINNNAFFVIGEGTAPAEMPAGVSYVDIIGSANIPWTGSELDCALYDVYGRLVDLVRCTRIDSELVHNHPRSPSGWDDFVGAGRRISTSDNSIGRTSASTDTNRGSDWLPLYTRSMGTGNSSTTYAGPLGHGDILDVRLNEGAGDGLSLIINAGPAAAGQRWSFFYSGGHLFGNGPLLGLGPDALQNYFGVVNTAPWFGFLDAEGSARLDFPPSSIPAGIDTDDLFILQNGGLLTARTLVIPFDT